jgi:hypothetical protein
VVKIPTELGELKEHDGEKLIAVPMANVISAPCRGCFFHYQGDDGKCGLQGTDDDCVPNDIIWVKDTPEARVRLATRKLKS